MLINAPQNLQKIFDRNLLPQLINIENLSNSDRQKIRQTIFNVHTPPNEDIWRLNVAKYLDDKSLKTMVNAEITKRVTNAKALRISKVISMASTVFFCPYHECQSLCETIFSNGYSQPN